MAAATRLTTEWRDDYNHHRPHGSLEYQTPAEFAASSPYAACFDYASAGFSATRDLPD